MHKLRSLIIACALIATVIAMAQAPPPATPSGPGNPKQPVGTPSPIVHPDGTITFNLLAPTAKSVILDCDQVLGSGCRSCQNALAMKKDDKGLWSITVGPLKPEFYSYSFIVDGAPMPDPQNARLTRDGTHYSNWAVVPGEPSSNYEVNNVPHGQVSLVWYPSPTLKLTRRMTVYTPPGYESGNARYPVLYLLHGSGGDEQAWVDMGRAPEIFDNLIAQGKMLPTIVVIPNGNEWQSESPNDHQVESPSSSDEDHILRVPDSIIHDLIPFVDRTYRTMAGQNHRAIAGLSRGGEQALYAALNHHDRFAWVGVFSGGLPLLPPVPVNTPTPADAISRTVPNLGPPIDAAKFEAFLPTLSVAANKQPQLLYLSIGTDDDLLQAWIDARKIFDRKGVKYTWVERAGYGHEWPLWRLNLMDFASRIFKTANR